MSSAFITIEIIQQINFSFPLSLFYRKIIPLVILEEGSYEKDVLLYVNLGEPQMVGGKFRSSSVLFFDITYRELSVMIQNLRFYVRVLVQLKT